jgi:hypothetical protein
MSLAFTDTVTTVTYSNTIYVGDITAILLANTAYVGFTGAYGGETSVQTVSDFTFVSIPPEGIQLKSGTNALVQWPGSVLGYTLQQNANLTTTNWLNVTNVSVLTNGLNQITLPLTRSNLFYRLVLPGQ